MEGYGTGQDGVPFHRFGSGPKPLVVIPGVMDALGWNTPHRLTRELLARYYFRAFADYDVWVASRQPGLSPGETVERIASRYEQFLECRGESHLLGLSLGGAVATHLAKERPELVDRLVLVACGTMLGKRGTAVVEQWRTLAENANWNAIHVNYAEQMYAGLYSRLVPVAYRLGSPLLPKPAVGSDVVISCDSLLQYDGRHTLEAVESPTLVVADTDGPLFPLALQQDAATRVQNGFSATMEGSHAVYEQSRREFGSVVKRFLTGQHTH